MVPSWVQAAAAGFALIALGAMLMVVGPEKPTRAAQRLVGETVHAGSSLIERKDRLVEDVRLLGVVLSTAFEGRLDRVNERVEDYRRLIEQAARDPGDRRLQKGLPAPSPSPLASPQVFEPAGARRVATGERRAAGREPPARRDRR